MFCLIIDPTARPPAWACILLTSKKSYRMLAMESGDVDEFVQYPCLLRAIRMPIARARRRRQFLPRCHTQPPHLRPRSFPI